MTKRKYIRIALTEEDEAAMAKAKARSEQQSGIVMSDSMFALATLRHAFREATKC